MKLDTISHGYVKFIYTPNHTINKNKTLRNGYVKFIYTPNHTINKNKTLRNGEPICLFVTQRGFSYKKKNFSKMTNHSAMCQSSSKNEIFMQR
jgi:hypothetical protein